MNLHLSAALLAALFLTGCAASSERPPAATAARLVPDTRLRGSIASVNEQGQFVVVDFNTAAIPPLATRLNVYRNHQIVGVVRLTGPGRDNLGAADIVEGEAAAGDAAIWDPPPAGADGRATAP
jgi:outer membrane biogenesis lipoprotein LolB